MNLAELEALWRERRSMRAFRPQAVPRETLTELFAAAQHAPSWCNVQPWRVFVTEPPKTGERLLDPKSIPEDLSVTEMHLVGNYGVGIHFSDGHTTGIYRFRELRRAP